MALCIYHVYKDAVFKHLSFIQALYKLPVVGNGHQKREALNISILATGKGFKSLVIELIMDNRIP